MPERPRFFEDTEIYRRHMSLGRMPYPEVIQFEVTSECDLRCIMCPLTTEERPRGEDEKRFSLAQVQALDPLWEHATEVELTGFGEIFTHPELLPILRHLRGKHLALYGSTNGQRLLPEVSEIIVAERLLDILCFSIDAATGETYRRIRRGGSWERLLANLAALQEAKARHASPAPILFFSFAAMRRNLAELPDFVRLAHRFGAAKVIVQHVVEGPLTRGERLANRIEEARPILAAAQEAADALGIELDLRNLDPVAEGLARPVPEGTWPTPAEFKRANCLVKDCPFPWEHVFLKSNYEVQICAILWEEMVMGSLRRETIEEIWNSPGYRALRRKMCGTDAPEECVYCYFKGWRRPTPIEDVRSAIAFDHASAGQVGRGWHRVEFTPDGRSFRWAKDEATFFLKNDGSPQLRVEVYEHPEGPFLAGEVRVAGHPIARITSHDLWGAPLLLALPPLDEEFLEITFHFDAAWEPEGREGQAGRRRITAHFFRAELCGSAMPPSARLFLGEEEDRGLGRGWYAAEEALGARARWSQTQADAILPGDEGILAVEAALPRGRAPARVLVLTDGEPAGEFTLTPDGLFHEHRLPLPAARGRYRVLTFEFEGHRPGGTGNRAERPLGAVFRRIELARPSLWRRVLRRRG